MKKTSTFQTIILVVFGVFIVVGMAYFSLGAGSGGDEDATKLKSNITIWGVLPREVVTEALSDIFQENAAKILYEEKREGVFDRELVEALASGVGPDMILLPQNLILRHSDKVYTIPYESMPVRTFKDRFIEEGELYLNEEGILAIPVTIDPMVMYWNRDIFSDAGVSKVPEYWDEFYKLANKITVKDNQSNILRSAISFGEFQNVVHAKEILSMLIMQAGNPITEKNAVAGKGVKSVISDMSGYGISPAVSALNFYTEFSNPTKSSYSWNRSLPSSFDMFTSGDLAVYFGFASELSKIKRKNPNLNFDVAKVPQTRDASKSITFGKMQGLSILKQSKNINTAFQVSIMFSDPKFIAKLSSSLELPPVRRDLLSKKPADAYMTLFYDSALISKAWLDPSPMSTKGIFKKMIENIVSGRRMANDAVISANAEMQKLLE